MTKTKINLKEVLLVLISTIFFPFICIYAIVGNHFDRSYYTSRAVIAEFFMEILNYWIYIFTGDKNKYDKSVAINNFDKRIHDKRSKVDNKIIKLFRDKFYFITVTKTSVSHSLDESGYIDITYVAKDKYKISAYIESLDTNLLTTGFDFNEDIVYTADETYRILDELIYIYETGKGKEFSDLF